MSEIKEEYYVVPLDCIAMEYYHFDRDFYNFNREEKDMHPYSVSNDEKNKTITITKIIQIEIKMNQINKAMMISLGVI